MSLQEDAPSKILIAGLPGSGLSTIKAVVVDNNPPKQFKEITEKLDFGNKLRDILQPKVLFLPCGGDKSIQDLTSRDNDPIYKNVEALMFVIDIHDQSKFSIAKYWFDNLVGHLHRFSSEANIFIILNKIDLLSDLKNSGEYIRATRDLFNVEGLDIYIHETSIYDASIFYAFKDVLQKEIKEQISIKNYLKRKINDSVFTGMAVYSKEGLPIYDAGNITPAIELAANVMLSTVNRISKELEEGDSVSSTILQMKMNTFMVFKAIDENSIFVGMSKKRPKLGEFLIETDQIVEVLKKAN